MSRRRDTCPRVLSTAAVHSFSTSSTSPAPPPAILFPCTIAPPFPLLSWPRVSALRVGSVTDVSFVARAGDGRRSEAWECDRRGGVEAMGLGEKGGEGMVLLGETCVARKTGAQSRPVSLQSDCGARRNCGSGMTRYRTGLHDTSATLSSGVAT